MKYALISVAVLAWTTTNVSAAIALYGGGQNWTGETVCVSGATCTYSNPWYSQCLPGGATTATTTTKATTSTTTKTTTSTTGTVTGCPSSTPAAGSGKVDLAGINIAGFDFGCGTDGSCKLSTIVIPLTQYNGPDGAGQMKHFYNDDGFNVFRLPTAWQFLTGEVLGGSLNPTNWAKYVDLVNTCLNINSNVRCIIDIHNYARWNGGIIGQGGPTDAQFTSLWTQIATVWKNQPRVIFGIMNEPHDVPSITTWASTVQAVVTAIRNTGATSQMILLPGNGWTSAETFISNGSADALNKVKNPDGSITGLIFDVHKYLDFDNSGTHVECTQNNISNAFAPLAQWLRCHGRRAFLTETGGGNTQSCVTNMCQQIAFIKANSDVYVGYVGWSAGSFDGTYELVETPTYSNGVWTDRLLVSSCLKP